MDSKLLEQLCSIFGPSGNETGVRDFIMAYVKTHQKEWRSRPQIIHGEGFQDCLMLKFGKPRTAVFSHMDSHGFTVRYENQLLSIGAPEVQTGTQLIGEDSLGPIECEVELGKKGRTYYKFGRPINTGTNLVFKSDFKETTDFVQGAYLDNRLGVYVLLKIAETLEDGLLVFSCWEEHGGGSVAYLVKYAYEELGIRQALVADITWATDWVIPGEGVVISLRDFNIPRHQFLQKIQLEAVKSSIPFQLEVEGQGSSDGREIQKSPYPMDWCFIGAAEENVHTPYEKVAKADVESMIRLYEHLLSNL